MKLIYNDIFPFEGYQAMTIWPFIFARREIGDDVIRHEEIHGRQQLEMLILPFFLWYLIEWVVKLVFGSGNAYRRISFEREANIHEEEEGYLKNRKLYAWFKYIIIK